MAMHSVTLDAACDRSARMRKMFIGMVAPPGKRYLRNTRCCDFRWCGN
jgi:hypothetical protein